MSSTKRMRRDLRNALFGVATQWTCEVCGKYRDGVMALCGTCEQAASEVT